MVTRLSDTSPSESGVVADRPRAVVWDAERSDAGFRASFVNPEAHALLGYPRDAWPGTIEFWVGITHPDDRARARRQLQDALASAGTLPSLVRWLRADGRSLPMEVHLAAVTDAAGAVVGLRGFALEAARWDGLRDELAGAQEQLAYASRRATLNELVASLVHEINQPLNAILNNAQAARLALDRAPAQPGGIVPMLDAIVGASERAADIIRRARGLASGGAAERSAVDLNAVVAEACALLASDALMRNAVVAAHPSAGPCVVFGDRVQLVQVVLNLASNALDAVSRCAVGRRIVDVAVVATPGRWAYVSVVDSGPGIPAAMLSSVFEPLFSTKAEGMGLGLDIASSIVRRHGGSMWVANNRDAGAHVVIALPVAHEDGDPRRRDYRGENS